MIHRTTRWLIQVHQILISVSQKLFYESSLQPAMLKFISPVTRLQNNKKVAKFILQKKTFWDHATFTWCHFRYLKIGLLALTWMSSAINGCKPTAFLTKTSIRSMTSLPLMGCCFEMPITKIWANVNNFLNLSYLYPMSFPIPKNRALGTNLKVVCN